MARMGGSKHLKAFVAPEFWPILRKEYKWTVKPSPGPHPVNRCIPLLILIRDILKYAKTGKEARRLIAEGHFRIDGRVVRDYKFPVGAMDVVQVVKTGEFYRVIPVPTKILGLVKIPEEEAGIKPCRIENKITVKNGHIQLNLHDGRNILIHVSDPKNPAEDVYETLGTIVLSLKDKKIIEYIPLKEGTIAIILYGRNVGRVGKVISIHESGLKRRQYVVTLKDKFGNEFQTSLQYVFPIGIEKPLISLPEGAW